MQNICEMENQIKTFCRQSLNNTNVFAKPLLIYRFSTPFVRQLGCAAENESKVDPLRSKIDFNVLSASSCLK